MADNDKLGLLKRQIDQVEGAFKDFRTYRQSWDQLIVRRATIKLEDAISKYSDGIDIQSPILEEDRGAHIKVLALDGPKIDCTSLEKGQDAEGDVEDIRLWTAASLHKQNLGQWVSNVVSQGQVQYGVAIIRKTWHMPTEPADEELPGYEGGEDYWESRLPEKTKARMAYFKGMKQEHFLLQQVSPYEMSWFPLDKPEVIIQSSDIPYVEALNLQNDKGEYVDIDALGKVNFVGKSQPEPEWGNDTLYDKKVSFIVRDMKDKQTGKWRVTEYLCPSGGSMDDATVLKEYDNPLGRSMYFIVPSGDEVLTESDPHLRYRPLLYSEYVLVQEYNYLKTLIASLARKKISDEDVYVDASKLTPEALAAMEESGIIEGVGAQRRLVFKRPAPGSGDIMVAPTLQRWPNDVEEHLMLVFEDTKQNLAMVRPNRFLMGQAYQETKEGTGAAVLDQHQAAALPYGPYLIKQEQFWKEQAEAEHAAIMYWDSASPTGTMKPYYATATPDLPLLRGSPDAGHNTFINAEKLQRNFVITVSIKNETQQEKLLNDQMAYGDFAQGTITEEQRLRRLGHDDPQGQLERLQEERWEKQYQPRFDQIAMQGIETLFSALTYLNLTQMAGGPPMMPTGQPGGEQMGGGQVGPTARPSITPSPIERPGGNGVGPTGVANA